MPQSRSKTATAAKTKAELEQVVAAEQIWNGRQCQRRSRHGPEAGIGNSVLEPQRRRREQWSRQEVTRFRVGRQGQNQRVEVSFGAVRLVWIPRTQPVPAVRRR